MSNLLHLLRNLNELIATVVGLSLLGCVVYTLLDIGARYLGFRLGGSDEISGYIMAIVSSWGVCYALTSHAHVRIDLIRNKLLPVGRVVFDVLSLLLLTATAMVIGYWTWKVLRKTVETSARANTPLETPLWIPQLIWWSGWIWFALTATVLSVSVLCFLIQGNLKAVEEEAGTGSGT